MMNVRQRRGLVIAGALLVMTGCATKPPTAPTPRVFAWATFDHQTDDPVFPSPFEKGKQVAETMREFMNPEGRRSVPGLAKTLERLERLKASGAISNAEFERLKRAAFDQA